MVDSTDACKNFFTQLIESDGRAFQNTVFTRLGAQGAYFILGLSGCALIRGGHLFEVARLLSFH